ncbi:hypothetical protein DYB26_014561 [Aphanomyces astaci]|uniref:Uncharacterized protein n=1 Tax=Aphanomyces astaci TaxID=112090 RepID=A0A418FY90_APHAT|nr:hypothetical protein DYB26_014561 [Aphanomyces astaci]
MSSDAGATTDEALTIVDETLARRRYFREKQREYRHKLKADAVAIAQEVMHLESIRDRLQVVSMTSVRKASEGPLSWHAIATVFKSEAHRVLTRRQSLVTQMQQFESLKRAMRRFVVMNIPVLLPSFAVETCLEDASEEQQEPWSDMVEANVTAEAVMEAKVAEAVSATEVVTVAAAKAEE